MQYMPPGYAANSETEVIMKYGEVARWNWQLKKLEIDCAG